MIAFLLSCGEGQGAFKQKYCLFFFDASVYLTVINVCTWCSYYSTEKTGVQLNQDVIEIRFPSLVIKPSLNWVSLHYSHKTHSGIKISHGLFLNLWCILINSSTPKKDHKRVKRDSGVQWLSNRIHYWRKKISWRIFMDNDLPMIVNTRWHL